MSNYANGRRAEYLARDALVEQGFTVVRAAGSKGAIDLAAFNYTGTRLIQIKKGAGRVTPAERRALHEFDLPPCSTVEIWQRARGAWKIEKVRERA